MCAENLLNAAIDESEKLKVKVNIPIVATRESVKLNVEVNLPIVAVVRLSPPPSDEYCNHGQRVQHGWFPQNGRSLVGIC